MPGRQEISAYCSLLVVPSTILAIKFLFDRQLVKKMLKRVIVLATTHLIVQNTFLIDRQLVKKMLKRVMVLATRHLIVQNTYVKILSQRCWMEIQVSQDRSVHLLGRDTIQKKSKKVISGICLKEE